MMKKSRGFAFIAFGVISITLLTISFVWVRLQLVNISYDIHELEKKESALRQDCNALTLRIEEARSPQRLERLAQSRFDLRQARADQIITLPASRDVE